MVGIQCDNCGRSTNHKVMDSRPTENGIERRRKCGCGNNFSTLETIVLKSYQKKPPRTVVKIMREFFAAMDEAGHTMTWMSEKSGVHIVTLSNWRHGKVSPNLFAFEAVVESLGYKLALVRNDA